MQHTRTLIFFTSLSAALSLAPAQAQQLFKEYQFGMPKSEFSNDTNFYTCRENTLCKNGEEFLGMKAKMALEFNDERLSKVRLIMPDSPNAYNKMIIPLESSGKWVAVYMVNHATEQTLDIPAINKSKEFNEAATEVSRFAVEALVAKKLTVVLVEITNQLKELPVNSFNDLYIKMAVDTRLLKFDFSEGQGGFVATFLLPKVENNELSKKTDIGKF